MKKSKQTKIKPIRTSLNGVYSSQKKETIVLKNIHKLCYRSETTKINKNVNLPCNLHRNERHNGNRKLCHHRRGIKPLYHQTLQLNERKKHVNKTIYFRKSHLGQTVEISFFYEAWLPTTTLGHYRKADYTWGKFILSTLLFLFSKSYGEPLSCFEERNYIILYENLGNRKIEFIQSGNI